MVLKCKTRKVQRTDDEKRHTIGREREGRKMTEWSKENKGEEEVSETREWTIMI